MNRKGFTLVELMVVAVIVAILAAVAIPLMTGNKLDAYETEAVAALGTIRTAMRTCYAKTKDYTDCDGGGTTDITEVSGIESGDLNGTYFKEGAYSISAVAADTFTAQCDWDDSDNHDDVKTATITNDTTIDEAGKITHHDGTFTAP